MSQNQQVTQVMEYTTLNYEKLSDGAKAPKRATPGSIGLDLFTPHRRFHTSKTASVNTYRLNTSPYPGILHTYSQQVWLSP